ncbi:MAG: hypothetical protein A3E01_04845 [Gammaproteobacteria bacterium RIFCSPHIGHO2_12_FULL_63_22]|nr:MAG: hypothetical protein A3E01_04845 [Gammaproteobacteria bacterium RIFCSPHIGHO2_12_FULL_63_22]
MSLIAELKRRNVIRMAGLYLVGAWLLVQVASTLFPAFGVPDWALRGLVIVLVLGFVPMLVFAWVFELTPDGIKRDAEVSRAESIAPQTARRMDRMIIAVLLLALIFFGFDRLVLAPRRDAALVTSTTQSVTAQAAAQAKPTVGRNSIAVLPFVNMSGEAANEYFSDGISEEILNVLAGTPELQVAARTSSFAFKGKTMEVPAIAEQLKVRMVLEGSVRKQGDKVRITAQLIDAQTGFHVWSQTYDRKLEDIFVIQDEIARAIGEQLKVKIAAVAEPGQRDGSTRNVAAYDLYLRGMALWHSRTEKGIFEAISLFEKAIATDPEQAQAHAGLALAYAVLPAYSDRMSAADALSRSTEAALHAVALDPAIPEAYAALSNTTTNYLQRSTSVALLRRAIVLRPSFATAHQWLGTLLMSNGDFKNGLVSIERAAVLDPRSLVIGENHAWILITLGRNADARTACLRVLEFAPTYQGCLGAIATADLLSGNLGEARQMLDRLAAAFNPSASGQGSEIVSALSGKADRHALAVRMSALPLRSRLDPSSGNALEDYHVASVLMLLGEDQLALDYVDRLSRELSNEMDWAIMSPALNPIRCEPRFVALVERLKTFDPYAEKVCAGKR